MIELAPYLFGMTLDFRFLKARTFSKERLDTLLNRLTDSDTGLALRLEQIRVRNTDLAFDYDLRAFFLGGNALLVYDAEKIFLSVSGGRSQADANLLRETAKRFLWVTEVSNEELGSFSVNTHARADSAEGREQFLDRFRLSKEVVGPGALGYVRVPNWPEEVRFSVEPSLGTKDSLFFAWNTPVRGASWLSSPEELTGVLESIASIFGVQFKPITP
jgi:hypothetical protein